MLTQVEVDANDSAFEQSSKPIGPVYSREEAERLATQKSWRIAADGDRFRRVVARPRPKRIFEIRPIRWLLEKSAVVICASGGDIPAVYDQDRKLHSMGPKVQATCEFAAIPASRRPSVRSAISRRSFRAGRGLVSA